jgi:hypothetical protein
VGQDIWFDGVSKEEVALSAPATKAEAAPAEAAKELEDAPVTIGE